MLVLSPGLQLSSNFNAECNGSNALSKNTGVNGSICFFTENGSPNDAMTSDGEIGFPSAGGWGGGPGRRGGGGARGLMRNTTPNDDGHHDRRRK
mmetsp:Transcript_4251/g.8171  ORF Transcript_4251/g.8171 Transcript_4251/m.8171 type:complete len:94 (+) Transcript_4251:62-343(+)